MGAVGVGAGVGHGEDSGSGVLQDKVLVGKLFTVDRLASGTVVVREVASLEHEVGDDTMEGGALVTETIFASTKGAEVLAGLRGDIRLQLETLK